MLYHMTALGYTVSSGDDGYFSHFNSKHKLPVINNTQTYQVLVGEVWFDVGFVRNMSDMLV